MQRSVYHSSEIQAWEQRWFAQQNSSLGLMQQAAWTIVQQLFPQFEQKQIKKIAVWCGQGNNAGDGYFIAGYLKQAGFQVTALTTERGPSPDLHQAYLFAQSQNVSFVEIETGFSGSKSPQQLEYFECHVDALFGIGLNRELSQDWQRIIHLFNVQTGLKIAGFTLCHSSRPNLYFTGL